MFAKTDQNTIKSFLKMNCIFSNIYALSVMVIAILGVLSSNVFLSLIACFSIYGIYALIYHLKLNSLVRSLEPIQIEKDVGIGEVLGNSFRPKVWLHCIGLILLATTIVTLINKIGA